MSNREKPKLVHIVIEAAIPVIIGLMFSVAVQWFTMESAIVNISASAELDGQYLTVVSVQNLKEETLPGLPLYIDSEIDILDMKSSDGFNLHQHYIESDSISPKSNYTLTIWTEQPILQGQIIAESDYKISMNSAERNTPFIVQILWAICVAGIVMIIGSSITLWFSKRRILQVQNNIREVEKNRRRLRPNLKNYQVKWMTKKNNQQKQSMNFGFIILLVFLIYKKNCHFGVTLCAKCFTIANMNSKLQTG